MNIYKELFKPSPCDGCQNFQQCADNMLACSDFLIYVGYGDVINVNRLPSADIYYRVYGDEQITTEPVEEKSAQKKVGSSATLNSSLWPSLCANNEEYYGSDHPGVTTFLNSLGMFPERFEEVEAF